VNDHPQRDEIARQLQPLLQADNPIAAQLNRLLDENGQNYLQTIEKAIDKIADQDVTVALLTALQRYFRPTWPADYAIEYHRAPEDIDLIAANLMQANSLPFLQPVMSLAKDDARLEQKIAALLKLSLVGETLVDPIFSQTDAVGSVMRKRLRPVTDWILDNVNVLKS
jgi:hypothetical protein